MDKYYYLIAQLPLLRFGEETYLTKDSFLEEAEKWLSDRELKELKRARLDELEQKPDTSFLKDYKDFELTLRKELASYRRSLSSQDLSLAGKGKQGEHQAKEVLTRDLLEGNPLEVEKKLFFCRWQRVEQLAQDFHFNREAVLAYFLKIQIL